MTQHYFITGTDTGVGKTRIAAGLLQAATASGLSTLGLKPVAAGCEVHGEQRINDDARRLQTAASVKLSFAEINPAALLEPLAPHIAAEHEGVELSMHELATHCQALLNRADFVIVEGAGGWQVPLNATETMASLAQALELPVILVVGMRLGCINHALLTVAAIERTGLRLAGWVANSIDPDMAAASENTATLTRRIPAPMLGQVPWLGARPDAAAVAEYLDLRQLQTHS